MLLPFLDQLLQRLENASNRGHEIREQCHRQTLVYQSQVSNNPSWDIPWDCLYVRGNGSDIELH